MGRGWVFQTQTSDLEETLEKVGLTNISVTEAQKKLVGPTFSKIPTIFLETSWFCLLTLCCTKTDTTTRHDTWRVGGLSN